MGYRQPRNRRTAKWGVFLERMARERDWSQSRMFSELHEGLGLGPYSRSAFVDILDGKRNPSQRQAEYLRSYFGDGPIEELVEERVSGTQQTLVEALLAQTDAINRLVAQLERIAMPAVAAGVQDALREAGALRGAAAPRSSTPPAPRD